MEIPQIPGAPTSYKDRRAAANSMLGNGFHLPSLMLVLILMLQSCPVVAHPSAALYPAEESQLRLRCADNRHERQ